MTIQLIRSRHSCCIWILWIRVRISLSISTLRAEVYMPDWAFMIRCSLFQAMLLPSVQVWQLQWQPYCWLPVLKANVLRLPHSRVMIHQPMGGAQGQASDIEITAREIQKLKKELYTIIADHSHTDFDKVWADSDRTTG